ncbi:ABC transporter ATP-binding protein [Nocardia panacis]|uniref:ABC transporter ATP-binding protein n=1 Tax=Nocardia panacis TaxID=2340916 RepID=A0A3A4JZI6_9NOCA|nr:ABC transporter ATP-binding protein [Nocardia panacis]RJO70076.1 ABC transporter ATP-binding protein [Nocardia panacis]
MTTTEVIHQSPAPAAAPPPEEPGPQLISTAAAARLLRPVRLHLITCAVLSALGAAAGFAPYVAIAEIARAVIANPNVAAQAGLVWTWVGIGAAGALARLLLLGFSSHIGHYADAEILWDIRTRIVARLGVVPLGWFRSVGSGQIKKVMTDDLEEMHHLIAHALGEIIAGVTAMLVGFGYLIFVDWRMALVTVAVPLLMMISFRVAMRSMTSHMTRLIEAEGRISAASVEYADGIAVVKTFGSGGRILDRFGAAVREQTAAMKVWVDETRYSSALSQLLSSEMTVLTVVLAAGVVFVGSGSLAVPDLLPFLVVGIGLPTSFTPIINGIQGLRKARMAADRIETLLHKEPLPEPVRPRQPQGNRIELDHVSFSYDGVGQAVHDISAVCAPGTVTAVVGPSGAGKSTLACLLPRFYDTTSGTIRVGGVDIREIPTTTLLSSMTLVFQEVVLLRDTVTENIRIGRPTATDDEVRRAAKAAQIHDVVEALPNGYDTVLDGGTGGLSGGERQRLTIARAILAAAPIVILDEATAALDPDGEAAVQDALSELVVGKTVIVIAHRLHTIAGADQILVMDRGRLVESGTHTSLRAAGGLYARMWRAQQNGDQA